MMFAHHVPILAIFLINVLSSQCGKVVFSFWSRSERVAITGPELLSADQRTKCAAMCSHMTGCAAFCHDFGISTCYVNGNMTSSVIGFYQTETLRCFVSAGCPSQDGYRVYSGRCLKLYLGQITQPLAQDTCTADGAHLYHYKALGSDRQPLVLLLEDNGVVIENSTLNFWVGATDPDQDGVFHWSDGTPLYSTSEVWASSEPSGNLGEYCTRVRLPLMVLADSGCGMNWGFACQIDL